MNHAVVMMVVTAAVVAAVAMAESGSRSVNRCYFSFSESRLLYSRMNPFIFCGAKEPWNIWLTKGFSAPARSASFAFLKSAHWAICCALS